jgi:hypothetical protein
MSLAERKAAEINAALDKEALNRQWVVEKKMAARSGSSALWEALVECVSAEVHKFAASVSTASTLAVTASPDSFRVETSVHPMVQLVVNRVALGITARVMTQRHSLSQAKQHKDVRYYFAADSSLEPCFSDYDSELSPSALSDILLGPVFDVFKP